MEWQAEQDLLCSGCGLPRDETMLPGGTEYNALPVRCRACEARESAARAFAGVEEIDPSAGVKWRVEAARD